jgi:hypothetical protein
MTGDRRTRISGLGRNFIGAALPAILLVLQVSGSQAKPKGVELISCDRNGAVIRVMTPPHQQMEISADGVDYVKIAVPGWAESSIPGKPQLPLAGFWLAIPPGAQATLSVENVVTHDETIVRPKPSGTKVPDPSGHGSEEVLQPDPIVYSSTSLYPQTWASIGEPCRQRTFQVVPVTVTPFRVKAGAGELLVADTLELRITFKGGRSGGIVFDPYGESLARSTILNYNQALSWREPPDKVLSMPSEGPGKYKLLVDEDCLYVVTYQDLQVAGLDPSSIENPETIKIYLQGEEIPIWVEGEWDGEFDPDDYILFFGHFARGTYTYENIYTRSNVYWLDWDGDPGLRMTERSVPPGSAVQATSYKAGLHIENDDIYESFGLATTTDDIDHWVWTELDATYEPEFSYVLDLPGKVLEAGQTYDLTVALRGETYSQTVEMDHHVQVRWNDFLAIDTYFSHQDALVASHGVATSYIYDTAPNELTFTAVPVAGVSVNAFYLDWFEVWYWRDYSVVNDSLYFRNPQDMGVGDIRYELTGFAESNPDSIELWNLSRGERLVDFDFSEGQLAFQDSASDTTYYFVASRSAWLTPQIIEDDPSDWKSPDHRADYLMITHENFYDALAPLESHYENRGLAVERIKVGDIYDEFSYGMKTPQAIFDYIQYAYFNYIPPIPAYVLLVGDASWDYKNNDSLSNVDYVPTHSFLSEKWGETASDNWFVVVSGQNPYNLPDLYIGRFPVNNVDETDVLVQKTIGYAQAPPGYWRTQVIFTNGAVAESDAVHFDSTAQNLIDNYFPDWYDPPRVYANPSPGNEQYLGRDVDLIQYINEGAAMVNYIGHAGNQMWETLDQSEISQLVNGERLPFVAAFSCFTGIFSNTTGFGETFILQPGGGAIAYWSNTALGYQNNNYIINDFLFQMLFDQDSLSFGSAAAGAKWAYATGGYGNLGDVLDIYNLLGDPAVEFVFQDPQPEDTLDTQPPTVSTDPDFKNDDFLSNPVTVHFTLYDDKEIETAPGELLLELIREATPDGYPIEEVWPWNWQSDSLAWPDTTDGHTIEVTFSDTLPDGKWRFEIHVEDKLNNVTSQTKKFQISTPLALDKALNWPNPFKDETNFTFILSHDARLTVKVYTVSGKLIYVWTGYGEAGYNIIPWSGRDQQGDPISNGTYLYKIIARSGSQKAEKTSKLIRLR